MKVINVNGRLETRGTWEETEAQAAAQVAGIAQQRAELRDMLSGNMQFHKDPHAVTLQSHGAFQRIMDGDLSDDEHEHLLRMRDGCRCGHPNARPPCGACTEPPTEQEAAELAELSEANPVVEAQNAAACVKRMGPTCWRIGVHDYHCDEDGWISHEPKADSVCPAPAGVRFEVRFACAPTSGMQLRWLWSNDQGDHAIVAWRPVA